MSDAAGPGPRVSRDARAELAALCREGLDWRVDPARLLPDVDTARPAAVLVLFGALDDGPAAADRPAVARDLDVLLQRRAASLGHHAGQISFPGGRVEAGDDGPESAALREAVEETGLQASGVEVLGVLPPLAVPVSNHLVTPVPAWWTQPSRVAAVDHAETVDVFRVPVADLLDPANRASSEFRRFDRTVRTPVFTVDGVVVWGFTAIVLSRMFEALGWAEAWDARRVVEVRA